MKTKPQTRGRTAANGVAPSALSDFTLDPSNRRAHTPRNLAMIGASLEAVGPARSIVIDEDDVIMAGNGVAAAAEQLGIRKVRVVEAARDELVAVRVRGLTPAQKVALALYDNRAAELAEWNVPQLQADLASGLDLAPFFTADKLEAIVGSAEDAGGTGLTEPDAVPSPRRTSIAIGDLFELGPHRLLCGDTTDPASVARVCKGLPPLTLTHADPPYGMGKEADGIANDNLYDEKLDAFQMRWWRAWLALSAENASAYIWGHAPDLWRLWWRGGLEHADLMVRNEIVWDKGVASAGGVSLEGSAALHSFPTATERCLLLMRGQQFLGSQNKDDYWDGFEPLRAWLEAERDRAGWKNSDINRMTASHMAGHWFTKSQFAPIPRVHYETLAKAAKGRAFTTSYDDLFSQLFGTVKAGGNAYRRELSEQLRASRTFFDNTHDKMNDVWNYPRVVGAERFGHATPKPVAMVARALRSSSDTNDVVGVPFGGTCPEIIAAEQLGRRCVVLEIEPSYCQVIVDRWEAFTGQRAKKTGDAPRLRKAGDRGKA
jgi:hypothetical protein